MGCCWEKRITSLFIDFGQLWYFRCNTIIIQTNSLSPCLMLMETVSPTGRTPEYFVALYLPSLKSVGIHWIMTVSRAP